MVDRFGTKWWYDKLASEYAAANMLDTSIWFIEEKSGRQLFVLVQYTGETPTEGTFKVLFEADTVQKIAHEIEHIKSFRADIPKGGLLIT